MHTMVNYILFMALLILLPSSIVHARKLTSKNAIFSVDLIPRNSSKINLGGGGRGKLSLGSISYHHQMTLPSKFYDLVAIQSAVFPDAGDYNMKISLGTPPVEFTAVADTGSDLIWVQCSQCQSQPQQCQGKQSPLFDPTQSSTDNVIPCTSNVCNAHQLLLSQTGCSTDNSCNYVSNYGFGDGTGSTGALITDTVTFPSTSISDVVFGCGVDQEGNLLGPNGNGIVGLGGGPLSLVSQLGQNINYKFSYCLTPLSQEVNSKLNFGLDVTDSGVVSIPMVQGDVPTHYTVTLDSISVGDNSVPVTNTIIVDSGTTLTYLPSDVYEGLKTAVQASIQLTTVNDPNQMFDPCYDTNSLDGLNFPGMVFHFNGGDVTLNAENSFVLQGGVACLAMLASGGPYLFGNIAQTNFHVGYDLQAKQVSFAPVDCTTF